MRRRLSVLFALIPAAVSLLAAAPANATPAFLGAGFTVTGVPFMSATWTVPTVRCASGESADAVVIGLEGTQIATLSGWNAASTIGCNNGRPWYRIQAWVNAPGGGHVVAASEPGDVVLARLRYGTSAHPIILAQDLTLGTSVTYRLGSRATTAAPSTYAGARVPDFSHVDMRATANGGIPLGRLVRTRWDEWRGRTRLVHTSYLASDNETFCMYWMHD